VCRAEGDDFGGLSRLACFRVPFAARAPLPREENLVVLSLGRYAYLIN
jgi:hypothetical protein